MCIKCVIGAFLGAETVEVGKISPQLSEELRELKKGNELQKIDFEIEVLQARRSYLAGELTEQQVDEMQADIDERSKAAEKERKITHKAVWDKVYVELGLPNDVDESLTVDFDKGVVTKRVLKKSTSC
ncbi:hypothetical protein [Lysinibacillus sp. 54212]|uniref:hypothetical protein n=1 Tax=Lysinibacillus sp. 54212 TaxID=3119829 RepID=UPI002FCB45EA